MHPMLSSILTPGETLAFGSPGWFWGLLILIPLAWVFRESAKRRTLLLSRILAPRLQESLAGTVSPLRRTLRAVLLFLSLALVFTGLARPRYGSIEREIRTSGRDVIIAIDTSRSMLSTDTSPTRLGRAKLIAQDLLDLLKGDRVGLIAFAGSAFLQAPLTLDKGAVLTSIQDLDTLTIPKGGTDIASAIRMAVAAFGKGETMSRALILMTDGDDLEDDAIEAAKEAAVAGVRIFTIGFGSPSGSLIPVRTEEGRNDFVRDENGRPVNSKLDADRLSRIATETGGFYQPFGQDAASVIYSKGILPMQQQEGGVMSSRKPIERYAWPITAALLLLALWTVLGEGRGRRPRSGMIALLLLSGILSTPSLRADAPGISDYRKGDYAGALKDFEKRLQSGSKSPEVGFDAGAAAYKAGDFKKASGYFASAMTSKDAKIRGAATYNLANSLVRSGEAAKEKEAKLSDWKNALQHYETVLKANPKNSAAKENMDVVRKLIEDLKKEDQKKNQDNQKNDQKKDQNKDQDKDKDQQKSDQSQGGGGGQKDSKDGKDSKNPKDQKNDQEKNSQNSQDQKDQQEPKDPKGEGKQDQNSGKDPKSQGSPTPTPTPSPSPGQGKENNSGQQDKDAKEQRDSGNPSGDQKQDHAPQKPSGGREGKPEPTPSPTPKKEGSLGGGEQGDRKQEQSAEAAEAEEGKDGAMSPNQARALLRSVQDEEAHQLMNQQNRAVEQPLRDW